LNSTLTLISGLGLGLGLEALGLGLETPGLVNIPASWDDAFVSSFDCV